MVYVISENLTKAKVNISEVGRQSGTAYTLHVTES